MLNEKNSSPLKIGHIGGPPQGTPVHVQTLFTEQFKTVLLTGCRYRDLSIFKPLTRVQARQYNVDRNCPRRKTYQPSRLDALEIPGFVRCFSCDYNWSGFYVSSCAWCAPLGEKVCVEQSVQSQLNGSHGEFTEGDDMKSAAAIANDQRARDHKVAANHMHHQAIGNSHNHSQAGKRVAKAVSNDTKPCAGFMKGTCTYGDKCKFSHDVVEAPAPEQKPIPKVVVTVTTYTSNAYRLTNGPDGVTLTVQNDTDVYGVDAPKLMVKAFGVGWYQVSSDESENVKKHRPTHCCETVVLQSYILRDVLGHVMHFPRKEYTVFVPLLSTIRSKCRGSTVDSHFCSGVYGVLSTYTANLPPSVGNHMILNSTAEYIIDSKHFIGAQKLLSTEMVGKMMNNGGVIGSGDHGRERAQLGLSMRHGGLVGRGQMWYTHEVPTALPYDWAIRTDLRVVCHGQAKLVPPTAPDPAIVQALAHYDFGNDIRPPAEKHRSHFVQFMGMSAFEDGKFTARSMNDSVKRLIGQRVGEDVFRASALDFAEWMKGKLEVFSALHFISSRIVEGHDLLLGRRNRGNPLAYKAAIRVGANKDREDFIWNAITTFMELTKPGYLEATTDFIKNTGKNTFYGIWQTWNEHYPWSNRGDTSSMPHIKRALRQVIHKGIPFDDEVGLRHFCKVITSNMKTELGKPGKSIRLVADMGAMCIYATSLPGYTKIATHGIHEFTYMGFLLRIFIYSKPSGADMESIARELAFAHRTNNCMFVAISSDDSCYAGCINGVSFLSNVDVSSNDSSQEVAAFSMVHVQQANVDPHLAWGLLEGNMLPFSVVSPTDPASSIVINFDGPMEPSGHPNTTVDNNAGSFLIAIHAFTEVCSHALMFQEEQVPMTEDVIVASINRGAQLVGHLVTYERCDSMAEIQFLKRSFVWSDARGCYIPVMNVAAYMRSLGTIKGDLECVHLGMLPNVFAATTNDERMNLYVSGVVAGWRHECGNSILNALRKRFSSRVSEEVIDNFKHFTVSEITDIVDYSHESSDSWLMDRYKLDANELQEIVRAIDNCVLGDEFHLIGLAKIFEKDYSLKYF